MSRALRRIGVIALSAALTLAALSGAVVAGLTHLGRQPVSAPPSTDSTPPPPVPPSADRIRVAVVLGASGSDAADVLAPYEVFARSPRFQVSTVAASLAPAALDGGLWVQPDSTFAQVASGELPTPDLIVVPAVTAPGGALEQPAREFVTTSLANGARVLGVCAGARLLAASGVLDGLTATSHWSRIAELTQSRPQVNWVRGERWVQAGRITTSGGVTSSIPAALHVVAELAGEEEAARVGAELAYPGWSPTASPRMPEHGFGFEDVPTLLNAAFPWGRPQLDIELRDGISEFDAAALFEVFSYSQAADTRAVSMTGTVRTLHGLTLRTELPSADLRTRTLVAGADAGGGTTALDAAFEQLAAMASPSVVRSVAKMLEYPLDAATLEIRPDIRSWRSPFLLGVAALGAAALGAVPLFVARARGRRRMASSAAKARS